MGESRESLIYLAKVAENAEQYADMSRFMKQVVNDFQDDLSMEERNMLSVAYKNQIGAPRSAWRVLTSFEQKEANKDNEHNAELIRNYRKKVEGELRAICDDVIGLLEKSLIGRASSGEAAVFYMKMAGDYERYHAEFAAGDEREAATGRARSFYDKAMEKAQAELSSCHPVRLGLALNLSVFYYEQLDMPQRACELAKTAFDDAIGTLEDADEETAKDSTLIMQLLRDNLTLWTSDMDDKEEA